MNQTSEWLLSFNSEQTKHLKYLVNHRKNHYGKSVTTSITGGKGGVGKTSISLRMSKQLASQGYKVLLIDCDTNLSNTSIKLNIPLNNNFYELVSNKMDFEQAIYQDRNFHLLAACNGSIEMFDSKLNIEEVLIDIISAHEQDYDFIFLDCPAGLTKESLILNAYCDHRIFVVVPDKASITDSYSLIKILNQRFGIKENHLIVNMFNHQRQLLHVVKTMSETVENFLGGRTKTLGGVSFLPQSRGFSERFLDMENSALQKQFDKIISSYTDELAQGRLQVSNQHEQEVHLS